MIEVKKVLAGFVVSARACTNQFLPCSSSSTALFGMRTVQADNCLNSGQIDTLFISVGGQEGGLGGGGVILGRRFLAAIWTILCAFTCGGPPIRC